MKRAGFTMIELIFVIVILGILAAVAVPKLAATRDDAQIAKGATEVATMISDLGSFYTAQGGFTAFGTMSNVGVADATVDLNNSVTVTLAAPAECITAVSGGTAGNGGSSSEINLRYTHANATNTCQAIAGTTAALFGQNSGWTPSADTNLTHTFGGSRINFN